MSVVAAVAAVTSVGLTIEGNRQQRKAAKTQRKSEERARRVDNAVARLENQKAIRQRIAEGRIEQANLTQQAESAGVSGSSSLFASTGSVSSSVAGDIGFARARFAGNLGASNIRSIGAQKAGRFAARAQTAQSLASVSSLFTNAKNNEALKGGFGF